MSDNDETPDGEETAVEDPIVTKVEETLDTSKNITQDHLNEMKKQLDARLDALTRDKTHDDQEKSELRAQISELQDTIKGLSDKIENKTKEDAGETMLIAPKELNPPQQNDGVEDTGPTGGSTPPSQTKKKPLWKRIV